MQGVSLILVIWIMAEVLKVYRSQYLSIVCYTAGSDSNNNAHIVSDV